MSLKRQIDRQILIQSTGDIGPKQKITRKLLIIRFTIRKCPTLFRSSDRESRRIRLYRLRQRKMQLFRIRSNLYRASRVLNRNVLQSASNRLATSLLSLASQLRVVCRQAIPTSKIKMRTSQIHTFQVFVTVIFSQFVMATAPMGGKYQLS